MFQPFWSDNQILNVSNGKFPNFYNTYVPTTEKNLKIQIAKLSNYAVKKGSTPFYRLSKLRYSEAEHKANGSSGSIQILSFILNALFITL